MQKALAILIQETASALRNQQKILLDTLKKLGTGGKSTFDFENKFEDDYNKNLGGEKFEQKQLQLKESRVDISNLLKKLRCSFIQINNFW